MKFPTKNKVFIQQNLINWFQKNQRELPWRKKYEPYHVWISEIMLQQTQVTTALPYFDRWIKELPDIKSVATASEDKILKLWEGLGYYSRARNLQKAAQVIMKEYDGQFPDKYENILKLPGIGSYTAGAITSIAFNKRKAIVDGNIIRVISRLMNFHENTRLQENVKKFWTWMDNATPDKNTRDFNQGMMELGALICTPRNPKCTQCPLKEKCLGRIKDTAQLLPNRGEKSEKIAIQVAIAIIHKNGKVFIQKRPSEGLMGGLWEFPGGKVEDEKPKAAMEREIKEELGISLQNIKLFKKIRHGYTKFSVDLNCFTADHAKGKVKLTAAAKGKWVKLDDLNKYPFPAANVKLIKQLTADCS